MIMNDLSLARSILTVAFSLALEPTVTSQAAQTNLFNFQSVPYASAFNREVDFMRSLLEETNRNFDEKVYSSVRTNVSGPIVISYSLVSFVFHYPAGVAHAGSATEMGQPDELVCTKQSILRRATTNEIPANYIRILDTHRKDVSAELDLLLGVAPLGKPEDVKYLRRCFRYVYRDGWKEE